MKFNDYYPLELAPGTEVDSSESIDSVEFIAWYKEFMSKDYFKDIQRDLEPILEEVDKIGNCIVSLIFTVFWNCWCATKYFPSIDENKIKSDKYDSAAHFAKNAETAARRLSQIKNHPELDWALAKSLQLLKKNHGIDIKFQGANGRNLNIVIAALMESVSEAMEREVIRHKSPKWMHNCAYGCLLFDNGQKHAPKLQNMLAFSLAFHLRRFTTVAGNNYSFGQRMPKPLTGLDYWKAISTIVERTLELDYSEEAARRGVDRLIKQGAEIYKWPREK